VKRLENGYRVYGTKDLARLNIIRTLRCAGYSLSAILRLMSRLDKKGIAPVEKILDTPSDEEDIVSVCDRLITSLENTHKDALEMQRHLALMRDKFQRKPPCFSQARASHCLARPLCSSRLSGMSRSKPHPAHGCRH
jgi:DNA-binding transcriptional MerR regulator